MASCSDGTSDRERTVSRSDELLKLPFKDGTVTCEVLNIFKL